MLKSSINREFVTDASTGKVWTVVDGAKRRVSFPQGGLRGLPTALPPKHTGVRECACVNACVCTPVPTGNASLPWDKTPGARVGEGFRVHILVPV